MKVPNKPPRRGSVADLTGASALGSLAGAARAETRVTTHEGVTSLRLEGFFRPAWMAGLCAGLAERGVSIQRVEATAKDGWWHADLQLDPPPEVDPSQIPYAELIDITPELQASNLSIERYRLSDSPEHGGTLRLEIDARDSLGLLGQVLSFLAMLSLFPVAMRVETRDGRAYDRFWLSGVGRAAPTQQSRALLKRMLAVSAGEQPESVNNQSVPPRAGPQTARASAARSSSSAALSAEFLSPPWTAPLDGMEVVRAIPDGATIAGMFPAALVQEAKRRGVSLTSARELYLPFEFYPTAEHALLLVQAAQLFFPDKPLRAALRILGRAAPDALLSSTLGRVVLGTAQGALAALEAIARTYAMNVRPSSAELVEAAPGRAVVRIRALPFFLDSHHVGVLEGTMRYAGVHGSVRIRADDAAQADLLCTWEHVKSSRPPRR
jgi:uncharacterized protein (TIGR02265 family)